MGESIQHSAFRIQGKLNGTPAFPLRSYAASARRVAGVTGLIEKLLFNKKHRHARVGGHPIFLFQKTKDGMSSACDEGWLA